MKLTSGDQTSLFTSKAGNSSSIGGIGVSGATLPGQGLLSNSSNTATWQPVVSTVTSNGSNTLLGPNVNLQSGTGVTFSVASNSLTITGTGGGSGSPLTVKDEGTTLTSAAAIINFVGAGVTATGTTTVTVTIPGGGSPSYLSIAKWGD